MSLDTDEQTKAFYSWVLAGAGRRGAVKGAFNEIGADDDVDRRENAENFKKAYEGVDQ